MKEKVSGEFPEASRDENVLGSSSEQDVPVDQGRRKSVAMNIVENPLKVGLTREKALTYIPPVMMMTSNR